MKNLLLVLSVLLLFSSCATKKNPNVVILYTDDQGTLDANCYGAKDLYTPNIDLLADNGILFTQAYAQTVCCPSRAALLTGRHPQRSGVNNWTQNNAHAKKKGVNMPLSEITIAEILKEQGYVTGLFGKWHLGGALENGPLEQGFDEFFGHRGGFIENYTHFFLHGMGFHDLWDNKEEIFERGKYFPALMTEKAIDFIEKHQEEPFFLYAAFNLPHYPEQVDSMFMHPYDNLEEPRRSYAKVVTAVDGRIGQIIDKLKELEIYDNTFLLFMSDNGHSTEDTKIRFDNHNSGLPKGFNYCAHGGGGFTGKWRGSKGGFLEGGIRVPAIISYPDVIKGGQTRNQIMSGMDILPTICEITGAELPEYEIDGYSLMPIFKSKKAESQHEILYFQWEDQWAVREGKWKLIVKGRDTTGKFSEHPEREEKMESPYLANLEDENPEFINYASQYPDIVERLTELHTKWAAEVFQNSSISQFVN